MFLDKKAKRSTMYCRMHDVVKKQSVILEKLLQRRDGKVTEMLMIDSVEFAVLNQIEQIGYFYYNNAVFLEKERGALDKSAKVGDMSQDIIRGDQVRSLPARQEPSSQ